MSKERKEYDIPKSGGNFAGGGGSMSRKNNAKEAARLKREHMAKKMAIHRMSVKSEKKERWLNEGNDSPYGQRDTDKD